MSELSYKRRLLATYKQATQNRMLLLVDVTLERALTMAHPMREVAMVEWALGIKSKV